MAIVQISRIQIRRGLKQDLPQLASAEMGWSVDTQQLYIGNGTKEEGAPTTGVTEILTEYSALTFTADITANVNALFSNISSINSNVSALQTAVGITNTILLPGATAGPIQGITGNNGVISYTLNQSNLLVRTGAIRYSHIGSTVNYQDEYSETSDSDIVLSITGNATAASLNYSTATATTFTYRISNN